MAENKGITIDLLDSTEEAKAMDLGAIGKRHNEHKALWEKDAKDILEQTEVLSSLQLKSYGSLETFAHSQNDMIRLLLGELGKIRFHLAQEAKQQEEARKGVQAQVEEIEEKKSE
jgi:hypothetical protein